jgi:hypothetical protein
MTVAGAGTFVHRGSNGRKSEGLLMPTNIVRLHRVLRAPPASESSMLLAKLAKAALSD